jgi:hypothetical protein
MPEPRAQRTLVKSPPEIWAEISDVGTLARHLGEFGEIRITEVKAETTVVWEGDTARGTVRLEPSGWGTRVTITAEAKEPEPEEPEPEAIEPEPEPVAEAEVVEEAVEPVADTEPEPEPIAEAPTPEPVAATPASAPRKRGLFARLFNRKPEATPEPEHPTSVAPPAPEPQPSVAPPTADASPAAEATPPAAPSPTVTETPTADAPPTAAASPADVEEAPTADAPPIVEPVLDGEIVAKAGLDPERIEAVLVGVLDDLGSAHHRPFSRG